MRIKAGWVIVEPWLNSEECIKCLRERGSILYVLKEPILAYSTLFLEGKEVIKNTLIALAHESYVLERPEDAMICSCSFAVIEKDSWGRAVRLGEEEARYEVA